jgi:Cu(I)/Ag(I) efflux system membrane protein CusA/SilA
LLRLIRWSVANRFLVLLASAFVAAAGVWAVRTTPLDAIPDLSDTQVIIRTTFAGPGAADRRGPGHVSADDDDAVGPGCQGGARLLVLRRFVRLRDLRGRHRPVLGALARARVPEPGAGPPAGGGEASLGPDATGVGWIYEYALVDRAGGHDLAQLRALQDWFLKYELKALPNVAEVATVGGMVRQYQVVVDPARLKAYNLPLAKVIAAIRAANQEAGGSVIELAEAEYMVRTPRLSQIAGRFPRIPVQVSEGGHAGVPEGHRARPAWPRDAPRHRRARRRRRGRRRHRRAALGQERVGDDPGGQGTAGAAEAGAAGGCRDRPVYDRSALIERAVDHLKGKLAEEFAVVALVCLVFLLHLRSALVAVVSLPLGVLAAFVVMRCKG